MTKNDTSAHTSPPPPASNPAPKKKFFDVSFYLDWCKACGICMAFCPKEIIRPDKSGKPVVEDTDGCIGCRFCEMHCPDFAITVCPRQPRRRKDDV